MILEEYITGKGQTLTFSDERSRCLGEIKIGFDRTYGVSTAWEVDYCWIPQTFGKFQTVVCRTETDSGGIIFDTTRALLKLGRSLEQVRFKETTTSEKFYAYIKYDFGILFQ